jgi:hypothetical protein
MAETKIRVVLDTAQAKGELRDLDKQGQRTSERVGSGLRKSVGAGLAAGVGFAVGQAGLASAAKSGFGDILGETFGAFSREIEQFAFGELGESARASKAARDQLVNAYAMQAGMADAVDPGAVEYYQQTLAMEQQKERGRTLIETDERFRSVSLDDVTTRAITAITSAIDDMAQTIADRIIAAFTPGGG